MEPRTPNFERPVEPPTGSAPVTGPPEPASGGPAPPLPPREPGLGGLMDWLEREAPALAVLALCCLVVSAQALLPWPAAEERGRPAESVTEMRPAAPETERVMERRRLRDELQSGLFLVSVLASLALLAGWFSSSRLREDLRLGQAPPRPRPAVKMLDLLALVAVLWACAPLFMRLAVYASPAEWWQTTNGAWRPRDAAGVAVTLFCNFLGYAAALCVVLLLARKRGGASGTAGLWPFWTTRGRAEAQTIFGDLGLGLAAYIPIVWVVAVAIFAGIQVLTQLGRPEPDQNPLLEIVSREAAHQGRAGVLAALLFFAAVGAAFFEELLFRGVLFNVLRRYAGTAGGAIGAALIFALIHPGWSQVLALFVLGLALTWLYERTGRLTASMALHALNNVVALSFALLGAQQ